MIKGFVVYPCVDLFSRALQRIPLHYNNNNINKTLQRLNSKFLYQQCSAIFFLTKELTRPQKKISIEQFYWHYNIFYLIHFRLVSGRSVKIVAVSSNLLSRQRAPWSRSPARNQSPV